jgi:hypothetical protein
MLILPCAGYLVLIMFKMSTASLNALSRTYNSELLALFLVEQQQLFFKLDKAIWWNVLALSEASLPSSIITVHHCIILLLCLNVYVCY